LRQVKKELAIIANPVAGGGRPYRRIKRHLQTHAHEGWNIRLISTNGPEHAGQIACDLVPDRPDLVAVCAGDGTIHEVATRLPDPPFPLAILPAGTANVLARELNLPLDPVTALDVALEGTVRLVDTGVAQGRTCHTFLLMAGVGFDAYVVSRVRPRAKRRLGLLAFYAAAIQALASYTFPEFEVTVEGETLPATSCVVANARGYGGGLLLTPRADMTDGLLDVVVVQARTRGEYAKVLWSAWRRNPREYPWVQYRRTVEVRVQGRRGPWVQVDGELMGTLPLQVTLRPSAFPLIAAGQPR
jgi:YegS/Rv2252/BmrU family lipid kinase